MRTIQLAIDIGSKFTTIYQKGKGFVMKEASLVYVSNKRNKMELIECGRAVSNYLKNPMPNEQAIYPIKEGAISHDRAAVLMYRAFLNKIATESFFRPKFKAIVCVSCGLTNAEKHDVEKILMQAGIGEVILLESPLAVYANLKDTTAHCLVDIGASKTEISVVNKEGIVAGCTINIGGNTVNQAILEYIFDEKKARIPLERVEILKKQLATLNSADNFVTTETVTQIGSGINSQIQIQSREIKLAIEKLFKNIDTTIISILSQIPESIVNEVATNGITLSGGTSRLRGLTEYMMNDLGLPVVRVENPEDEVAAGAKYYFDHPEQLASILNVINLK